VNLLLFREAGGVPAWWQPLSFFSSMAPFVLAFIVLIATRSRLQRPTCPRRGGRWGGMTGEECSCCADHRLELPTRFPQARSCCCCLWRAIPERRPMQERTKCLRCLIWPNCCSRRWIRLRHLLRREWQGWSHGGRLPAGLAGLETAPRKRLSA